MAAAAIAAALGTAEAAVARRTIAIGAIARGAPGAAMAGWTRPAGWALAAVGAVGRMTVGTLRMTLTVGPSRTIATRCEITARLAFAIGARGEITTRLALAIGARCEITTRLALAIGPRSEIATRLALATILSRGIAPYRAFVTAFRTIDRATARIDVAANRFAARRTVAALTAVGAIIRARR